MPLILHVGSHKTGTTAIQRFAAAHRKTLRRRGLWYPSYDAVGGPDHHAHHHFVEALGNDSRRRFSAAEAERFMAHVRASRKKGEAVLLSAEPIYRLTLPAPGGYWPMREAYLQRLRDVVGDGPVKIVVVLRRQDSFARSLYQEKVKRGFAGSFKTFIAQDRTRLLDYRRQVALFKQVFGEVDVLVFEDLVARGLVPAFFAHLGIGVEDLPPQPIANPSLPIELVEFKRLLNGMGIARKRLRKLGMVLAERSGEAQCGSGRKVDWLSSAEMGEFYAPFEAENEDLRRSFAGHLPAPLFPPLAAPGSADEPVVYEGMSASRFRELLELFEFSHRVDLSRLSEDQLCPVSPQ